MCFHMLILFLYLLVVIHGYSDSISNDLMECIHSICIGNRCFSNMIRYICIDHMYLEGVTLFMFYVICVMH